VSSGIEPVFTYSTRRPINTPAGKVEVTVEDYGVAELGVRGKVSADVTPQEHVDVLLTAQKYVDSAVSKTCNTTGATPWDEFMNIYKQVYLGGGKGCTTFNRDGRRKALLETAPAPAVAELSCAIDAEGRRDCS
jgi:ribonucleoside-diphosphate reductase alpha chain